MPGTVAVIACDRTSGVFRAILDDEDHTDYPLGEYEPAVVRQLTYWWGPQLAGEAAARAREFGAAIVNPVAQTVRAHFRRTPAERDLFADAESETPHGAFWIP